VLASGASETPPDSPMARRLGRWLQLAESGEWGELFSGLAVQMRPGGGRGTTFDSAARLQPRPATPERFIGELRTTLDPGSWVTDRLGEVAVPTLVLAGGEDHVVPVDVTRRLAEAIPGARLEIDPQCGHTVRASFHGYHQLVEAFLAEGD
jgi:pimeloyl-ACP methyl ester carboxylesterase